MDWIKKHYDQFLLALAAAALLILSALIILNTRSFGDSFSEAQANVVPSDKVAEVDLTRLKEAQQKVNTPALWKPKPGINEFLFASEPIMIDNGVPKPPREGSRYKDSLTGADIPNAFFVDGKLPLLDPGVAKQDPDKDGFTNEEEWRGNRDPKDPTKWGGSTDPSDPKSHPKYVSKLFLKQWIRIPFVVLFQAYDVDAKDPKDPTKMTFQINATGRSRKTEFLKLGEKVTSGPYKLEKFEQKTTVNPNTGAETDVSELTIVNTETNDPVVLVLSKPTNSPDSFAEFDYQWNNKTFPVKKLVEFALEPERDKRYKLIDITDAGALVRVPEGPESFEYLVVPDPRAKR